MKRIIAIASVLVLVTGCLPTRNGTPFAEDGNGSPNNVNNNVPDGGNNVNNNVPDADNNVNNNVPDGGNNVNNTPDGGNNVNNMPDAGNNVNNMPDAGNNQNNMPDMPPQDMCAPEDDPTFCQRQGAECGQLTSADNCGTMRTVDCGDCTQAGEACESNMCEPCNAENDNQFCQRNQAECGELTALDNCMVQRTVNCGGCMGNGVGCNLDNVCVEVVCDDGNDNDNTGGADCDDPNCLGQRCAPSPNKVCQANGNCE